MFVGLVLVMTTVAYPQDTTTHRDSVAAPPPASPTIEQIHYMAGLKLAARGVAQIRDGLNRVARVQKAD